MILGGERDVYINLTVVTPNPPAPRTAKVSVDVLAALSFSIDDATFSTIILQWCVFVFVCFCVCVCVCVCV
jgi:hypothetical protein